MKNILMLTDWYPTPKKPINGIFIQEQIEAIKNIGYQCFIGYRNCDYYDCKLHKTIDSQKNQIFEFNYKKTKIPFCSIIKLFFVIWKFYLSVKQTNRIDIIHTHTFAVAFPASIICKIYGIKHIHTEHWSEILLQRLNKVDSFKYKFVLKNATMVLPVSNELKKSINSYYKNSKSKIVSNIISDSFSFVKNDSSGCNILFVGNLIESKGILDLLEISKQLLEEGNHFFLTIVGSGMLREKCESFIKTNRLEQNVFMKGQISYYEIHQFFQGCSFYCQPSYFETFGITYRQAISCGKPIVAYKLNAFDDDFDETNSLLCNIGDREKLKENIKKMLKIYKEFNEEEIAKNANSKYSKKVFKKNITEIYNKVLS